MGTVPVQMLTRDIIILIFFLHVFMIYMGRMNRMRLLQSHKSYIEVRCISPRTRIDGEIQASFKQIFDEKSNNIQYRKVKHVMKI